MLPGKPHQACSSNGSKHAVLKKGGGRQGRGRAWVCVLLEAAAEGWSKLCRAQARLQ